MKKELGEYGVKVVAISKDSVEAAAHQAKRDQLTLTLLSDAKLGVIRKYGVEHHKAIEFSTGSFTIGGLTLALVPSVKTMAIPTSLLVDESGKIVWVDQAEDYRLRSNEERVMKAVQTSFDRTN